MHAEQYVKLGAVLLLCGTALFSYAVVYQSQAKLVTHFVVELSQNLYFVGLVLTYVLWGAVLKAARRRVRGSIQFGLVFGSLFQSIRSQLRAQESVSSMNSVSNSCLRYSLVFLPAAWTYAFLRIPEDARLAPARLAVIR